MTASTHWTCDNYVCGKRVVGAPGAKPHWWYAITGPYSTFHACSKQCLVEVAAKILLGNVPMGRKVQVAIEVVDPNFRRMTIQ